MELTMFHLLYGKFPYDDIVIDTRISKQTKLIHNNTYNVITIYNVTVNFLQGTHTIALNPFRLQVNKQRIKDH